MVDTAKGLVQNLNHSNCTIGTSEIVTFLDCIPKVYRSLYPCIVFRHIRMHVRVSRHLKVVKTKLWYLLCLAVQISTPYLIAYGIICNLQYIRNISYSTQRENYSFFYTWLLDISSSVFFSSEVERFSKFGTNCCVCVCPEPSEKE